MPSVNPIVRTHEPALFSYLTGNVKEVAQKMKNLDSIGKTQKSIIERTIAANITSSDPKIADAVNKFMVGLCDGVLTKTRFNELVYEFQKVLPHSAAMKRCSQGIAIMAEGWQKPIVFPAKENFNIGFIDNPEKATTKNMWMGTHGIMPSLITGSVGNSNIKPGQISGKTPMCNISDEILSDKKKLSELYEHGIIEFWTPILDYLQESGFDLSKIGSAYAHSYCGVDKAARDVAEKYNLMSLGVTPTEYTQYVKGTEMPPNEEFPNGYVIADFPHPSLITRDVGQIEKYAEVYGKMVGKGNPLAVFGGGEHAFKRDAKEALIGYGESIAIPVDLMTDRFGVVIPATETKVDEDGTETVTVLNAARDMLERCNGIPYAQFMYSFGNLPKTSLWNDIKQYPPQAAITTICYQKLKTEADKQSKTIALNA